VRVAEALLEYEVLDGDEVTTLIKGEDPVAFIARKRRQPAQPATRPAPEPSAERPRPAIAPNPIKQPS
jgi:hypothetical protein